MLLLVYLLPNLAPQDLPWTALDLDAPIGRATAGKVTSPGTSSPNRLLYSRDPVKVEIDLALGFLRRPETPEMNRRYTG